MPRSKRQHPETSMPELQESIAQHYHERTKYDPETIATKIRDWTGRNNQYRLEAVSKEM